MIVPHSRRVSESILQWPISALDFEASSLFDDSYPIEIGIARWRSPDEPIEVWSTLIRPPAEWRDRRWSMRSQEVHGIRREELEDGMDPAAALRIANRLAGRMVFCDGGQSDLRWLGGLEEAAGLDSTFLLRDADALGSVLHPRRWRRMARWLDRAKARHRAGDDAERLLRALAVALNRTYGHRVVLDREGKRP